MLKSKYVARSFILFLLILSVIIGYSLSTTYVMRKIDKLGGVKKLHNEASLLIDATHLNGGETFKFLNDEDLKRFVLIKNLGNSVRLVSSSSDLPDHIKIRYGSHFLTKFIYIFRSKENYSISSHQHLDKVTANIYITSIVDWLEFL